MYQDTLLTGGRGLGQRGLGFARVSLNSSDFLWISLDSDLKKCIRRLPLADLCLGQLDRGCRTSQTQGYKQGTRFVLPVKKRAPPLSFHVLKRRFTAQRVLRVLFRWVT